MLLSCAIGITFLTFVGLNLATSKEVLMLDESRSYRIFLFTGLALAPLVLGLVFPAAGLLFLGLCLALATLAGLPFPAVAVTGYLVIVCLGFIIGLAVGKRFGNL